MGGFGGIVGSQGFQGGMSGLSTGIKTGTAMANAEYNAAGAENAARAAEEQSRVNAYLIQKQYEADYRALNSNQERMAAENQVLALKRGITGASADNAMQAYAAKDQRNKERLYYNAAMRTGAQSIQAGQQANRMREMARQYRWQAKAALVSGIIETGTSLINSASKNLPSNIDPVPGGGASPVDSMNMALKDMGSHALWDDSYTNRLPTLGRR